MAENFTAQTALTTIRDDDELVVVRGTDTHRATAEVVRGNSLTSVSSNATLTGAGTSTSPLAVAAPFDQDDYNVDILHLWFTTQPTQEGFDALKHGDTLTFRHGSQGDVTATVAYIYRIESASTVGLVAGSGFQNNLGTAGSAIFHGSDQIAAGLATEAASIAAVNSATEYFLELNRKAAGVEAFREIDRRVQEELEPFSADVMEFIVSTSHFDAFDGLVPGGSVQFRSDLSYTIEVPILHASREGLVGRILFEATRGIDLYLDAASGNQELREPGVGGSLIGHINGTARDRAITSADTAGDYRIRYSLPAAGVQAFIALEDQFKDWDPYITYANGDQVVFEGKLYIANKAIAANASNGNPSTATSDWDEVSSGGSTNISIQERAATITVRSSSGSNGTIDGATDALAGAMLPADRTQLTALPPEWATGSSYDTNDQVAHGGKIYESLSDSNSGNNPETDSANWRAVSGATGSGGGGGLTSVASDSTLTGAGTTTSPLTVANPFTDDDEAHLDALPPEWAAASSYDTGDQVSRTSKLYESLTDSNSGNDPATDTTNWRALSGATGGSAPDSLDGIPVPAWTSGESYVVGELVRDPHSRLFMCYTTIASSTTAPAGDAAHWIAVESYQGAYADNSAYPVGALVTHSSNVYFVITAVAATNTDDPTSNTAFLQINDAGATTDATITGDGTSGNPLKVARPYTVADEGHLDALPPLWNGTGDSYTDGDQVAYDGSIYAAKNDVAAAAANQNPASDTTNWAKVDEPRDVNAFIKTWAQTGNASTRVPETQIDTAITRDTELQSAISGLLNAAGVNALILDPAQVGNSDAWPDAKIPAGIARDAEVTARIAPFRNETQINALIAAGLGDYAKWEGEWAAASAYVVGAIVQHDHTADAAYICIQDVAANVAASEPGAGNDWTDYWFRVGWVNGDPQSYQGAALSGDILTLTRGSGSNPTTIDFAAIVSAGGGGSGVERQTITGRVTQTTGMTSGLPANTDPILAGIAKSNPTSSATDAAAKPYAVQNPNSGIDGGVIPLLEISDGPFTSDLDTTDNKVTLAAGTYICTAHMNNLWIGAKNHAQARAAPEIAVEVEQSDGTWSEHTLSHALYLRSAPRVSLAGGSYLNSTTGNPGNTYNGNGSVVDERFVLTFTLDEAATVRWRAVMGWSLADYTNPSVLPTLINTNLATNPQIPSPYYCDVPDIELIRITGGGGGGQGVWAPSTYATAEFALTGMNQQVSLVDSTSGDMIIAPEDGYLLVTYDVPGLGLRGSTQLVRADRLRLARAATDLTAGLYTDTANFQIHFEVEDDSGTATSGNTILFERIAAVAPDADVKPSIARFDVTGTQRPPAGSIAGLRYNFDAAISQSAHSAGWRIVGYPGTAAARPATVSTLWPSSGTLVTTGLAGGTGSVTIPATTTLAASATYTIELQVFSTGETIADTVSIYHDYVITAQAAAALTHFGSIDESDDATDIVFASNDISTAADAVGSWTITGLTSGSTRHLYWAVPASATQPTTWTNAGANVTSNLGVLPATDRTINSVDYKIYITTTAEFDDLANGITYVLS